MHPHLPFGLWSPSLRSVSYRNFQDIWSVLSWGVGFYFQSQQRRSGTAGLCWQGPGQLGDGSIHLIQSKPGRTQNVGHDVLRDVVETVWLLTHLSRSTGTSLWRTNSPAVWNDKDQFLGEAAVGEDAARCKEAAVSIFTRIGLTGVRLATALDRKISRWAGWDLICDTSLRHRGPTCRVKQMWKPAISGKQ